MQVDRVSESKHKGERRERHATKRGRSGRTWRTWESWSWYVLWDWRFRFGLSSRALVVSCMAESSSLPGSSDRGRGGWVSFVFVARIGTIVRVGANGLEASELLGCCAAVPPTETMEKIRERDRGERRGLGLGRKALCMPNASTVLNKVSLLLELIYWFTALYTVGLDATVCDEAVAA